MTARPLPPGWRWVRLGEVCEFEYGSSLTEQTRREGVVPVYGSNGVVGYHDTALTVGPAIVVGRKGSVGQVHLSPVPCYPIDTTYFVESPKLPTDLTWLAYLLGTLGLPGLNKASGVPGLNRNDAYALEVPLPPLDEQRRIAAILDAQMEAVAQARKAAEERLAAVNALPAAYLRAAFPAPGAPLPPGWRWVELRDVAIQITDGTHVTPRYQESGVRFISIANIQRFGPLRWGAYEKFISREEHEFLTQRCKPERDDILVAKIGTLGIAKRIDFDEEVSIFVGLALVKPNKTQVWPAYLEAYLNSPEIERLSRLHAQGGGRQTLPLQNLQRFPIPLPPLDEQRRIAAILNAQMEAVARARKAAEDELATINALPAALLRRAFNGEL